MPTYEFSLPDGQSFEIDSPTELNNDQLSYVASNHKQFLAAKQPQEQPSVMDDLISGTKGTAAFVGDVASGLVKLPVQAAATALSKAARPDMNLNELWNAAGQSIEGYTPSFGSQIPDNQVYNTAMKPFELYGKGADWVAEKAGEATGSPDVQGAIRIASNFAPIPFMGHAVKGGKAILSHVDPALRETAKAPVDKMAALDAIAPKPPEYVKRGANEEQAAPIDRAYLESVREQQRQQQSIEQQRVQAQSEAQGINADAFEAARQDRAAQSKTLMDEVSARQAEDVRTQDLIKSAEQEAHNRALKEIADREMLSTGENTTGGGVTVNRKPVSTPDGPFGALGVAKEKEGIPRSLSTGEQSVGSGSKVENRSPIPGLTSPETSTTKFDEIIQRQKDLTSLVSNIDQAQRKAISQQSAVMRGSSPTVRVPKNQRGGINLDEIAKAFGATFKRAGEAFNALPGHETTGKYFLANYPADKTDYIAKVKAGLSSTGDRWAKWESFRSGSSMKYVETQHPVIKAAADYMQTAYQRADRTILNVVKPIEHSLQKFAWSDKKGLVELGQLFKKEMFEKRTFTPEQLAQAGFSDKQIKLYSQIREAFDKAWSAQNEVLKAKGISELSKHEYYLSSRWTGDWRSNVYDKEGRLVWVIKDHSRKGVEQALDHLESSGIPIDREKSEVAFTRNNHGTPQDVPAAYASMMQHISESNPLAQKAREVMDAKLMATAQDTLAQSKHFKNKSNIRGFVGDRPWMNPFDDARDMFHEQINYLKNSFQWSEYNKAATELKDILNDPDIVKQAPKAIQQANHIVDHYLGATEHKMFQRLEDSLSKSVGKSRQDIQNAVSFAKTGWILQKMGTNVGAIAQNIIQPVNTIPFHTILSEQGMKHNPLKTILASTADTVAGLANHYGRKIGAPELGFTSKIGQDALRYAEQNGILDLSAFDEHTNVNSSRAQVAVQRTLGLPVMTADKISKFSAFLSFVHHLDQSGKFPDRMSLFREAEHYMNASMVDPRMPERPFVIQDTGIVGNAASTLQSYTMNYLNQLHMLSTRAFSERKPTALLEFLAISGALSGLAGMTAVNYGVAGYDAVRNQLAKIKPEWYDSLPDLERLLLVDVGEGMGKTGEAMKYGVPSMLTGADLSKKFETTVSAPVVGPVVDVAKQAGAVASGLMEGSEKGLTKAAYAVAPAGVGQGLIDVDSGAFQDKRSGKYAPPSSGDFSKGYFRSDTDKLMRRLGVTSIPESRQKEIIYQQAKAQANDKLVNNGLAEKYVKSIMEGDGAKGKNGYLANLSKRAPDQTSTLLQRAMQKYVIDHNLDAAAINIMKAKHLQAVQNWQKYYGVKNETQR